MITVLTDKKSGWMKNASGCIIGVDKRYHQRGSSTAAKTSYTAYTVAYMSVYIVKEG